MRVDAHQHFWQWDKGWFSRPEPVLSRDYMPPDYEPILTAHSLDKTIVVQTCPAVAETEFLLQIAETAGFIAGVVGWLDLESPRFAEQLRHLCRSPYFVAVRPMLESLPEDNWILRPRVLESLSLIAESGIAIELLTFTRHLPYILRVLDEFPHLRAVIDHLSKPEIRTGRLQPWQDLMREVAVRPNAYCKLSGMMTEADPNEWTIEQLRPYADHVMAQFGAERIMFGSDWPVCLLASSFAEVMDVSVELVAAYLGQAAVPMIFGRNAARFYRLTDGPIDQTASKEAIS